PHLRSVQVVGAMSRLRNAESARCSVSSGKSSVALITDMASSLKEGGLVIPAGSGLERILCVTSLPGATAWRQNRRFLLTESYGWGMNNDGFVYPTRHRGRVLAQCDARPILLCQRSRDGYPWPNEWARVASE